MRLTKIRWLGAMAAAASTTLLTTAPGALAINSYNASPAPERTEVGAFIAL
jgi:hypothetical protein